MKTCKFTLVMSILLIIALFGCDTNDPEMDSTLRYQTVPYKGNGPTRAVGNNGALIYSAHDTENDLYYYVYLLGHINRVPVAYRQAVIWDGTTPMTIGYSSTDTNAYTITEGVEKATEYSFTSDQSHSFKLGVEFGIKGAGLSSKISTEYSGSFGWSEMNSRSLRNTYETAISKGNETTDSISVTIGEHGQPVGKYRYSLFCTTDIYYVVVVTDTDKELIEAYTAVCARPASYAWGIDYEPDLAGYFGKTAPGDLFQIPDLVFSQLPDPTDEFEEGNIPQYPPVDKPVATITSGTYTGEVNVMLSTTTTDAEIYYTLNGGNPTTGSTLYQSGTNIKISENTILKAIAVKSGMTDSEILTEQYIITEAVNYVKRIYFGYNSNASVALSSLRSQTSEAMVTLEGKDLNQGAGGQYIYIGYTITNNPNDAIRGLVLENGKNASSSFSYNGASYSRIGPDLNIGAGGDYIWLNETRSTSAGDPIRSLFVQIGTDQSAINGQSGWTRVAQRTSSIDPDLNKGAKGQYIYLWMQK